MKGIRLTVKKNPEIFQKPIGDLGWFDSTMIYLETTRNRIAHINTLTQDEVDKFEFACGLMLDIIDPDSRATRHP